MQLKETETLDLVQAARDLAPHICAARAEMDRERRIPAHLARLVDSTGAYRLFSLPRGSAVGGRGVPHQRPVGLCQRH